MVCPIPSTYVEAPQDQQSCDMAMMWQGATSGLTQKSDLYTSSTLVGRAKRYVSVQYGELAYVRQVPVCRVFLTNERHDQVELSTQGRVNENY